MRCPYDDQLWSEKHISHHCQPPPQNPSFAILRRWNIGTYCNPATGKDCGDAAPDDAPNAPIVKIFLVESARGRVASRIKRKSEPVSDIIGDICEY